MDAQLRRTDLPLRYARKDFASQFNGATMNELATTERLDPNWTQALFQYAL
jgi:hypothetical protein